MGRKFPGLKLAIDLADIAWGHNSLLPGPEVGLVTA